MILLDGKKTSNEIQNELKEEVSSLVEQGYKPPHLVAILVGNDGASVTYVNAKVKACENVGFKSTLIQLPENTTQKELLNKVAVLNTDDDVDGFIVQLPLPDHLDELAVTEAILPHKDVDGFHPNNVGKMVLNLPTLLPATPYGIMQIFERYKIPTAGKHCVVIGRSNIVGYPMSILMGRNSFPGNCTVTLTHSRTQNIEEITKTADILIVAIGKPEYLTADMIKEDVVVIDVGITRIQDDTKKKGYRLLGDVKFDEVSKKASHITPVPGGVGPMTIISLLKNTLNTYKKMNNIK